MLVVNLQDIQRLAKERGLSQAQLAVAVGVAPAYLWQMLNGKRKMSLQTYQAIAAILQPPMPGVAEQREHYRPALASISLEEARTLAPVALSEDEKQRIWAELKELGDAYRRLPRLSEQSDHDLLGYDENGLPT